MSYISVTGFVFIAILFPGIIISLITKHSEFHPWTFCESIILHIISPFLMIFYTFKNLRYTKQTTKQYFKKTFWYYLIYPWAYTIYLILRVIYYINDPFTLFYFSNVPVELIFPYVASYDKNAIFEDLYVLKISMLVIFIIAHILFVFFNILYFFIIKKITKKMK